MSELTASPGTMRMIEAVPDRLDGAPRQMRRFWSDDFKAKVVEEACRPDVNVSALARRTGVLPSQLYRWRRELLGDGEAGEIAGPDVQQSSAPDADHVVEIIVGTVVVRVGEDINEAHLQRVIRAVRSA